MGFYNRRFTYTRIFLIVFFILLFALYIHAAKFYVPSLIRDQIKRLEKDRDIEIGVKNINLDLIRGLVFSGITVGNAPGDTSGQVFIKKAIIRPDYIKSISERRLAAGSIKIVESRVEINNELFDLIGKFGSNGAEKDKKDISAGSKLDIGRISIDDISLALSESFEIDFKKLNVELPKIKEEARKIVLSGYLSHAGTAEDSRFTSELEFKKDKKLFVGINFPELKSGSYSPNFNLPKNLSFSVFSEIDYKDRVLTLGKVSIGGTGSDGFGNFSWDARLIKDTGSLELDFLSGGITGLLGIDVKGRIGKHPGSRIAGLSGKIKIPDISVLSDWFPILKKFDLRGSLTVDELNIDRTDDTLGFNVGFLTKDFEIDLGEGDRLKFSSLISAENLDFRIIKGDKSRTYKVSGDEFKAKGFSYLDFETDLSDIGQFNFNYKQGLWDLGLSASGPFVKNSAIDAEVSDYYLDLKVEKTVQIEVSGEVKGTGGRYVSFLLNEPSTRFKLRSGVLTFTDLDTVVEKYGKIKVDKGELVFPSEIDEEYVVEIHRGKYRYFETPVISDDIRALFTIKSDQDQNSLIKGKLISKEGSIYGNKFYDLSFEFNSYLDEYKITDILARFLDGKLNGELSFKSSGDNILYGASMELTGPEYSGNGIDLSSNSIRFNSDGTYSGGLLYDSSGSADIKGLSIGKDSRKLFNTSFNFTAGPETISFKEGFISNEAGGEFAFTGYLRNYDSDNSFLKFSAPDIPLAFILELFSGYLPDNTFLVEVDGSVMIDFEADSFDGNYDRWNGKFEIDNSSISAYVSDTEFLIENMQGSISIKDKSDIEHKLIELLGTDLSFNREVYKNYLKFFQQKAQIETKDFIRIGKIKYGFFEAENIGCNFEMDKEKINLLFLRSDVYAGHVYANGLLNFGSENEKYNINMLFSDLSLESISNSLPSMKGYITGQVEGLLWFTVGNSYTTINGPFAFWARDSKNEKRTIGRALLEKIGAKGRFFTGSSRRYNRGEIAGYIKDGLITFKKFIISNKILGYTDLKIQADEKMNSISVKHLFSVIRELARRASKGDVEIEYQ